MNRRKRRLACQPPFLLTDSTTRFPHLSEIFRHDASEWNCRFAFKWADAASWSSLKSIWNRNWNSFSVSLKSIWNRNWNFFFLSLSISLESLKLIWNRKKTVSNRFQLNFFQFQWNRCETENHSRRNFRFHISFSISHQFQFHINFYFRSVSVKLKKQKNSFNIH